MKTPMLTIKLYAGNPQAWFDEEADPSDATLRRRAPLHKKLKCASLAAAVVLASAVFAARVDLYPQSFDAGGWVLDAQFMDVMGSPYLLAHGLGVRVTDAKARVTFPEDGEYRVWVRTRNWADGAPGRFRVLVNGRPLPRIFGAGRREWAWEDGGIVKIYGRTATVALEDLTGFDGRCAGISFVPTGAKMETVSNSPNDLDLAAMMQPLPATAIMRDPGYFVWGGSMVKGEDGLYHLFYSRWKKETKFGGWVTHSEIAHANAPSPFGPWTHRDVALPKRGAEFWDGMCTHNPCIRKFDGMYYLYYMGNTGDGKVTRSLNWTHRNNQRIGVAVAKSPSGPWQRADKPLIDVSADKAAPDSLMTSNPAVAQRPDGTYELIYKAVGQHKKLPFGGPVVHLSAISKSPVGPFVKNLDPIFTDGISHFPAEDPCMFTLGEKVYTIIKDQNGYFVKQKGRSLVLFEDDGNGGWRLAPHAFITGTTITHESGEVQRLKYLERPQIYIEDGRPVALLVAAGTLDMKETFNAQIPLVPPPPGAPTGPLKIDEANVSETVKADLVIVGGGMPGSCAAVAAARRGLKVALVQDRPVLGGNASGEIRVYCAGEAKHPIVREMRGYFMNRDANIHLCDKRRLRIVEDEKNIDLHLLTRAFGVEMRADGYIAAVKAIDLKGNRVIRFEAPLFCDATGDGWVGFWAGADWRMGRESKNEYGEDRAPDSADGDTLGASIMWTSADANQSVPFSAPWAEPHAQGVVALNGEWNWEYGIHRDMITEAEEIRDRMLLAIYGSFSLAKKKTENANKVLNFCPWLIGKRESRRIMGDFVLSQSNIVQRTEFGDSIATGSWSIDLHYDNCRPGVDFLTTTKGEKYGRFWIPYRSIYSRNVPNLFMAGRCFSCTHVGLGAPRVINTLSQIGVAVGEAAALCREKGETPRGIFANGHVRELQNRLGGGFPGVPDVETSGWTVVDDESEGVRFGRGWIECLNQNGDQIGQFSHRPQSGAEPAVYPLPVPAKGRYTLMCNVPYSWSAKRGSSTAFVLESDGRKKGFSFDQAAGTGFWRKIGEFEIAPGATLTIIPSKSKGFVSADGFAAVPL